MPNKPDDNTSEERELQALLRSIGAVVMMALFAIIVVMAVLTPLISDARQDTTLVLGLAASIMGALPVLLGVQLALSRKPDKRDENNND
jgi:fumarate reductase subunit D